MTSVVPPGAAGTMIRTDSVGRQSAYAERGRALAAAKPAAPASTERRETRSVMVVLYVARLFGRNHREAACGAQAHAVRIIHARLFAAENLEHVGEVGEFLAARWRLAADVVE